MSVDLHSYFVGTTFTNGSQHTGLALTKPKPKHSRVGPSVARVRVLRENMEGLVNLNFRKTTCNI